MAVVAPMLVSAVGEVVFGPANVGALSEGAVPLVPVELLLFEQLATRAANISSKPICVSFLNIEILSPLMVIRLVVIQSVQSYFSNKRGS